MRLLATLLVLLAAIYLYFYLHLGGVQTNTKDDKNIFVYNNGVDPNVEAYVKLLEELRSRLTSETDTNGIAVTRPPTNVPLQERFVEVQLENSGGEVITVIIDTVNVYVVGYLETFSRSSLQPTLHYLNDTPRELLQAFPSPQYFHSPLGFAGNYDSLPHRDTHELGHGALNDAIRNLYFGNSQPSAVLVIIQMVAEAVRIRYIEHLVRRNMMGQNLNFIPDPRARSMENRWSDLSEQIQWSGESGVFLRTIQVQSVSNEVISITSVVSAVCQAALALMLYRCNPNTIRMPVSIAIGADEQCPYGEPTTNIIGRDGKCMDVENGEYTNENPIILFKCGNAQPNQLWTFKSDGTIRSKGKCLTTNGYNPGDYIMIFDCDTAVPGATKWFLYNAGIINRKSGLVIAAETARQGTVLRVVKNTISPREAWSAGNYTHPTINYISGFREMCLEAHGNEARVWLANCVIGTEPRQQWALYGDDTIRLFSDRNLCLTSDGIDSKVSIVLYKCQGFGVQRWTFMDDGTILSPFTLLVMDVEGSDPSLQNIILYPPTGMPNQNWLAF